MPAAINHVSKELQDEGLALGLRAHDQSGTNIDLKGHYPVAAEHSRA